jgi:hypothetical protein
MFKKAQGCRRSLVLSMRFKHQANTVGALTFTKAPCTFLVEPNEDDVGSYKQSIVDLDSGCHVGCMPLSSCCTDTTPHKQGISQIKKYTSILKAAVEGM